MGNIEQLTLKLVLMLVTRVCFLYLAVCFTLALSTINQYIGRAKLVIHRLSRLRLAAQRMSYDICTSVACTV